MTTYLPKCESHLQRLFAAAAESGGDWWPSVVDTRTGRRPDGKHIPKRVYRLIGAPRGSTLYWDQPIVVAAYTLSELTGDPQYAQAANRYVDAFLNRCIADSGLFQWGNHQYYDLLERRVIAFHNGYHELRPITPAWEVFWRRAPRKTETYIRQMADRHLYDPTTGGFNRHDDRKKGHAFLEAGGILCESLAWLHARTGDRSLADMARRIARYSFDSRNPSTGLVPNEPDFGRWDSKVCTSEIGLWAQCVLRAHYYTCSDELHEMARDALCAYLNHALDPASGRFFGQVRVHEGQPVFPDKLGYWPRTYADVWNADQWPTHDYPMAAAEACLTIHSFTDEPAWLDFIQQWAALTVEDRPGLTGSWCYAENYGRCIHFLTRAGLELADPQFLAHARALADEAIAALWECGMFRGYPSEHLYESVDGVGFLMLALMYLETQRPIDMRGFGF